MPRISVAGKSLYHDGQRFHVRGVSYGPFRPNSRGESYPEPEGVRADFALMRELGANVVRTYVATPQWLLEEAATAGLRVMIGFPWPAHLALIDSRQSRRQVRELACQMVAETRHMSDAIFAYSLANEIRADIVRWHGPRLVSNFVREVYDAVKQISPESLFTFCNYPSVEYLDLSFFDFISFNVYLHREDDFRRYMTHLLAIAGDRPVLLSETGMDTIREGVDHQRELLSWQARAVFELGLAGMIIFAFTDEWFTGGSEITDWAFGLVTKERSRKPAFDALATLFRDHLPPPLPRSPKISVIVAAWNAESTLGECLESLQKQDYPSFEIVVVDDGSVDRTAEISEAAGAKVLRQPHRGLAAARNAGVAAADGEIVAFIDADAKADSNWLYHLAETIERRHCPAAGGPNFAPLSDSALIAALAAAPGIPREVRLGDDALAQVCGCNMAIRKLELLSLGGFDETFNSAGDDVDLSWRFRDRGETLAAAPAAVVTHRRRSTVSAYVGQQRGYGAGEALLFKKFPFRSDRIYGGGALLKRLFGGSDIVYYGEFGRGLFQSIYGSEGGAALELALSFEWIALSVFMLILSPMAYSLGWLGFAGVLLTFAATVATAFSRRLERSHDTFITRLLLIWITLVGSLARGLERTWGRFDSALAFSRFPGDSRRAALRGDLRVESNPQPIDRDRFVERLRTCLIERGFAVRGSDPFALSDLEILVWPFLRVRINAIPDKAESLALRWRLRPDAVAILVVLVGAIAFLAAAHASAPAITVLIAFGILVVALFGVIPATSTAQVLEWATACAREEPANL